MNTFLPYNDFKKVAKCLDRQRLNKQVLECTQILNVILVKKGIRQSDKKGWHNHPVFNLWTGENDKIYIHQLIEYTDICYNEWIKRGYKNESWIPKKELILKELRDNPQVKFGSKNVKLKWSTSFIDIMRANLIRKDRKYYEKYFGKGIRAKEGYIWENCKIKGK